MPLQLPLHATAASCLVHPHDGPHMALCPPPACHQSLTATCPRLAGSFLSRAAKGASGNGPGKGLGEEGQGAIYHGELLGEGQQRRKAGSELAESGVAGGKMGMDNGGRLKP